MRQPSRGCFTLHFSFFPEHYSLWAWGCHSQKTTIRSQIIPAAWAKRKRTGRLKKVRLVLGGNEAIIIISMADSMNSTMPQDWQPLSVSPPCRCDNAHYLDYSVIPHGDCTDVIVMLCLCLAAVMHVWHSHQHCPHSASCLLISLHLRLWQICAEPLFTCQSTLNEHSPPSTCVIHQQ